MAVKVRAPATTQSRIVDGLANVPNEERASISVLSKTNRIILAKNKPDSTFVGSFSAFNQFASKMASLL